MYHKLDICSSQCLGVEMVHDDMSLEQYRKLRMTLMGERCKVTPDDLGR